MKGMIYIKMEKIINQFILKEGYRKIGVAFGISVVLFLFGFSFFAKVGGLVTLAFLWIYRNNQKISKNPANLPNTIYAPIDGKIASIDTVDGVQKVYIDTNLCKNHILRSPIDGLFKIDFLVNGLNLSSWAYKSKGLNNRATISFQDANDELIKVNLISGFCGTQIILYEDNKQVTTREPIGIFIQGTLVIEVPKTYQIIANIGDKMSSGISVIAGKIE